MQERCRTDDVRVIRVALRAVQERPEAVDFDQTEPAHDGAVSDTQVQKVDRQQAKAVDVKHCRIRVIYP